MRPTRLQHGMVAGACMALAMATCLTGCTDGGKTIATCREGAWRISLEQRTDSLHALLLYVEGELTDSFRLPWPVYRLECGDLTGDGIPEVCVGVVKPTRYHPREERRLFIFHLFEGRYIRPLWLGSRVGNTLLDFQVCRDSTPACIHTTEYLGDVKGIRREYFHRGFGLQYRKDLTDTIRTGDLRP